MSRPSDPANRQVNVNPTAPRVARSALLVAALTACGGSDSTSTSPSRPPDAAAGRTAFLASCATCHASRDGYDLALFGFTDADIVRRALNHVNQATAENIVAYVRTLGITPVGRNAVPFQPGGSPVGTDADIWQSIVGTDIARSLTPEALRAVNLRQLAVPIRLMVWSNEPNDVDWMPETPLLPELLNASNGVLRKAIDTYYAGPTTETLVRVITAFEAVSRAGTGAVCEGEAGAHPRAPACFEARRWISSLAAVHLLRTGQSESPTIEVVDQWWETGEVAVSLFFKQGATAPHESVYGWLYLAYTFAPHRFAEENGYLGQFLQSGGFPRLASFVALRRMVDPGVARTSDIPAHVFWDAYLAVVRAPSNLKPDVYQFAARYLNGWLDSASMDAPARTFAIRVVGDTFKEANGNPALPSDVRNALASSRDRLLERLGAN